MATKADAFTTEAMIGKVSPTTANFLNKQLLNRADRQNLIDKGVLRSIEPEDVNQIEARKKDLSNLLNNRPSRERLQRLNVIKEENATVSPVISIARDRLKKAQEKDKLESFLTSRPEHGSLLDKRIILDERDMVATAVAANKSRLETLMVNRPGRQSLIDSNIIIPASVDPVNGASSLYVTVPTRVQSLSNARIVDVGVGWSHTTALTDQGVLYTVGSADNGRLGRPLIDGADAKVPQIVKQLAAIGPVTSFSSGVNHQAAILAGRLYVWGEGQWGRLGLGDFNDRLEPTLVESLHDVVAVACGAYHTVVLTGAGSLFSFGWNKFGRLGTGTTVGNLQMSNVPVEIEALRGVAVVKILAGWVSSAAITSDGKLYTWGTGSYGILGHGNEDHQSVPKQVAALSSLSIVIAAIGEYHMMAKASDDSVYVWGRNDFLQLGHTNPGTALPNKLENLPEGKVVNLACGKQYSMLLLKSGKVYTWGRGTSGVLGHGDVEPKSSPTLLASIETSLVTKVAGGFTHSAVCTSDGQLLTFGSRANGQLGE